MNEKEYLEFLADAVESFSNEIIDKTDSYTLSGKAVINTLLGFRRYVINLIEKRLKYQSFRE